MGIDFTECEYCKECFPDCGDYYFCRKCKNFLCDSCALENQCGLYTPYTNEETELYDNEDNSNCPFCLLKIIPENTLLKFALKKLGLHQEELEEEYRSLRSGEIG